MSFNYSKICQELLKTLLEKEREVISRRFGLIPGHQWQNIRKDGKQETLQSIGKDFAVSRERIRQLEADGLSRIKLKLRLCQKIFQCFVDYLKKNGGLKKEENLFEQLAGKKYKADIFFLLTLGEPFKRFAETKEFYSFWTIDTNSFKTAKMVINSLEQQFQKINQLLSFSKLKSFVNVSAKALESFLEISKIIQNKKELYGLKNWPEINPRNIKDKSYLVLRKEKRPLHFMELSQLIEPEALPQTVHNELIRNPKFVLVGRGTYALSEWGYTPGKVKDVIWKVLNESQKPLTKKKILQEVLKQRLVKTNTILLNLNNKKYFLRDSQGKYQINPQSKFTLEVKEA